MRANGRQRVQLAHALEMCNATLNDIISVIGSCDYIEMSNDSNRDVSYKDDAPTL